MAASPPPPNYCSPRRAVDRSGTLYIADNVNNRIRTVRNGFINEFAGASHAQGDGGEASAAPSIFPANAWLGTRPGNLYIADTENNRIRKVSPNGNMSTIAGNGSYLVSGDSGPALTAGVSEPQAVAVDSSGNVFIVSVNQIRKIDGNGNITTVVNASNTPGFGGDGAPAAAALLYGPHGLTIDSAGNLYIADSYNNRVRKVSGGNIVTVAGSGPICGSPGIHGSFTGDGGAATSATLFCPMDVALDRSGRLLIADTDNNRIRGVDRNGTISTVAGLSGPGYGGDLSPATSAPLNYPHGIAADNAGNFYIADTGNEVIRSVDAFGVISTIAGNNKTRLLRRRRPRRFRRTRLPLRHRRRPFRQRLVRRFLQPPHPQTHPLRTARLQRPARHRQRRQLRLRRPRPRRHGHSLRLQANLFDRHQSGLGPAARLPTVELLRENSTTPSPPPSSPSTTSTANNRSISKSPGNSPANRPPSSK